MPTATGPGASSLRMTPSSPAMSTSSYDLLSNSSGFHTATEADSDDEIVWGLSSLSLSGIPSSPDLSSASVSSDDEDYVLLRPRSQASVKTGVSTPNVPGRAQTPAEPIPPSSRIQARRSYRQRRQSKTAQSPPASAGAAKAPTPPKKARSRPIRKEQPKEKQQQKVTKPKTFTVRPIVDDVSESGSDVSTTSDYEDASEYITSFLSDPTLQDSSNHLPFLQSLIVELGLATSSIPESLRAARAVIKSQAFVNIREYLAVRSQGLEAIRNIMFPSRSALVKHIRSKKSGRVPRNWVKENRLQILLVSCYH